MPSPRTPPLKALFLAARGLSGAERASFLDNISDPALKLDVERLLAADSVPFGILEKDPLGQLDRSGPTFSPGDVLSGRYRIVRCLAEGGFACVYLAEDQAIYNRPVVLKFPAAGLAEALRVQLLQEAHSLARIEHQGVVGLLELSREDGQTFLIMRYIEGRTLREELSNGPMNRDRALRILGQIADALEAAHRKDVLHLDLKPENVVLQNPGQPDENAVIIDFGLAVIRLAEHPFAIARPVAGSISYIAPECVEGEASAGADVFALGVIALELLGGPLPRFWVPESTTVRNHLRAASIPAAAQRAIVKATCKSPNGRPSSPRAFVAQLNYRTFTSSKWVAIVTVALFLGCAIGLLVIFTRPQRESPLVTRKLTSEYGLERYPALSPDGKRVFYSWLKPTYTESDLYVRDIGADRSRQLTSNKGYDTRPACSPDGKWLVFVRGIVGKDSLLVLMPADGSGPERILTEGDFHSLTWFPDGRSVLISGKPSRDSNKWVMRQVLLDRLEIRRYIVPPPDMKGDIEPAFSPDGRSLVFVRAKSRDTADVYRVELSRDYQPTGEPRRLTELNRRVYRPQWTPDGKTLYFLAGSLEVLAIFRISAKGGERPVPVGPRGRIEHLAMALHSARLVYSVSNTDSNIWAITLQARGGPVIKVERLIASTAHEEQPRLSPDERFISFQTTRSGSGQLWLSRSDGSEQRQLSQFVDPDAVYSVWNPLNGGIVVMGHRSAKGLSTLLLSGPNFAWSKASAMPPERVSGYSRDGAWIYYVDTVGSEYRLFRRRAEGGPGVRITDMPADSPIESFDGKTIYFGALQEDDGVWRVPWTGGHAVKVVAPLAVRSAFAVGREGLYYVAPGIPGNCSAVLRYRRFDGTDHELKRLAEIPSFGLYVSKNEDRLLMSLFDIFDSDLVVADLR